MYKAVIFDLGNVIMNTDYQACINRFEELGTINMQQRLMSDYGVKLLTAFERGHISATKFRTDARSFWEIEDVDDERFDSAWNAMLLNIPVEHLNLIIQIRKRFKTYLLSNTNEIHLEKIKNVSFTAHQSALFNQCFDFQFYSHEMGCRKPEKIIFNKVLEHIQIAPEDIIFVDDDLSNITSANSLGFHTLHINDKTTIFALEQLLS